MKKFVIVAGFFLASCAPSIAYDETLTLQGDGHSIPIRVEIADTPEERAKGLMDRTFLPDGTGMLFQFDGEEDVTFWMKNTLIPLDILFFDANGSFVSGTTMVPCQADPCPLYASEEPTKTALEVPAGFLQIHPVEEDWSLVRGR